MIPVAANLKFIRDISLALIALLAAIPLGIICLVLVIANALGIIKIKIDGSSTFGGL